MDSSLHVGHFLMFVFYGMHTCTFAVANTTLDARAVGATTAMDVQVFHTSCTSYNSQICAVQHRIYVSHTQYVRTQFGSAHVCAWLVAGVYCKLAHATSLECPQWLSGEDMRPVPSPRVLCNQQTVLPRSLLVRQLYVSFVLTFMLLLWTSDMQGMVWGEPERGSTQNMEWFMEMWWWLKPGCSLIICFCSSSCSIRHINKLRFSQWLFSPCCHFEAVS